MFRAVLFLAAYATILGAPLYFVLRVFFESVSVSIGVASVLVGAAVIDKARRHRLLRRATWQGHGILSGEIFLVIVVAVVAALQYLLPDVAGSLIMFAALAFPAGLVAFVGFMALWIAGVMMVPRELQRPIGGQNAT